MKYTHILTNHAVVAPFIRLVNDNFEVEEHVFFVINGVPAEKVPLPVGGNVYSVGRMGKFRFFTELLKTLYISKKIFLHGLFSSHILIILTVQPWLLKKSNWLMWGGDLYQDSLPKTTIKDRIVRHMRKFVISRVAELSSTVYGDFLLAKKWFNAKGNFKKVAYSFPISFPEIDRILEGRHKGERTFTTKIMIGNSASLDNRHAEIMNLLEKYRDQNIDIYCPLSYGDAIYAQEIVSVGKSKFDKKFHGLLELLPFEEFVYFVEDIDIVVFNHERQQGFGNLLLAIYLGKKVYINRKSTLWELFCDYAVFNIDDIEISDFEIFSSFSSSKIESNRKKLIELVSDKEIVSMWNCVFDKN